MMATFSLLRLNYSRSSTFDREDEQNVLAKRKTADLRRHFKSMRDKLAKKDERYLRGIGVHLFK